MGEAVIPRPDNNPFKDHLAVVMRDVKFKHGRVTAFHAYFNETPAIFCFEIWRPEGDLLDDANEHTRSMTLIGERCVDSGTPGDVMVSSERILTQN